jgi:hypothetical protein
VFENKMLRRIFGPKRDKVKGGEEELMEELRALYSSRSILTVIKPRRMEWDGHIARMGKTRKACRLVGKPGRKRPLRRPRRRWVDNIKMNLGGMGWGGVDWIGLTQDRDKWRALVNALMNFRVPQNAMDVLVTRYFLLTITNYLSFYHIM